MGFSVRDRLTHVPRTIYAVVAGIFAAGVSAAGSGTASYWGDEAASILSAERSLSSLWPMLGQVDAVHGLYYVFLHFWIDLFGPSEFATRLPSALAVGAAAAGLLLLVWRLRGPGLAVTSVLIFAILPRVTSVGTEARGYAFAVAGVVWLVYAGMALARSERRRTGGWVLWSIGLAVTATVFMYSLLILIPIGVWLLLYRRGTPGFWRTIRFGALGGVLSLPIIAIGFLERGQISFLANRPPGVRGVLVTQWFGNTTMAVIAWSLIAIAMFALVAGALRARRAPADAGPEAAYTAPTDTASPTTASPTAPAAPPRGLEGRSLEILALTWAAAPPIVLALISILSPSYSQRYLSICTPAVAILMALGAHALAGAIARAIAGRTAGEAGSAVSGVAKGVRVGVVAVILASLLVAALPSIRGQRAPTGKDGGADFRQIAETLGEHARPGDTVIFNDDIRPSRKPRLALRLYPEHFEGLRDPGLITPYDETAHIWDVVRPSDETAIDPSSETVWLVISGPNKAERVRTDLDALARQGYTGTRFAILDRSAIYQLTRQN